MRSLLALTAVTAAVLAFTPSALSAPRLYAPSYGTSTPETISGFQSAADGSLAPLPGSPFPGGPPGPTPAVGGLYALAFTPEGGRAVTSFLFDGGAHGLAVAPDGSIALAGEARTSPSATGLAVSPDGRFAYTPTRDFSGTMGVGIVGYSIDAAGGLTELDASPFSSSNIWDVAITPDGRFLYATTGAAVKRFSIGADGALSELTPAAIPSVVGLQLSPDGRFLFASVAGSPSDGVRSYSIGPDGSLTENGAPALTGDVSLDYFAVAADGRHIYMPDSNANTVTTAAVAGDGTLQVVDSMPIAGAQSAAVTPDGRFLYLLVGNAEIGVASLGADGKPALLPFTTPFETGEPVRLLFQPQPAPAAAVSARPGFPRAETRFDARASARAVRYDWDWGDGTTLPDGGPTPTHVYGAAGVYTARVTVTDERGCSTRQIYTGQSTTCPGGPAAAATAIVDTLPSLGRLRLKNRAFAALSARRAPKRGTRLLYRLSEAARVRFTVARRLSGRRVRGRCRPATRRNRGRRRCARFKRVHAFTAAGKAGANSTRFSGKVRRRSLPAGGYRVTAVATDQAGGKSPARSATFRIVRARNRGR